MIVMRMAALVQTNLPACFVASQHRPAKLPLGASGNTNKNIRRVKLMHLNWEFNLQVTDLFLLAQF